MPQVPPPVPRSKLVPLAPLEDWQIERIEAGLTDAKAGSTVPAGEFFAAIVVKYGWSRLP